jgi:hypothetical protein
MKFYLYAASIAMLLTLTACGDEEQYVPPTPTASHENLHMAALQSHPFDEQNMERLLPPSALAQKEFPRSYVLGMMRACFQDFGKSYSLVHNAGKDDQYCTCTTEKQISSFTFSEFITANQAHFDAKTVPEAAAKNGKILAECTQRALN